MQQRDAVFQDGAFPEDVSRDDRNDPIYVCDVSYQFSSLTHHHPLIRYDIGFAGVAAVCRGVIKPELTAAASIAPAHGCDLGNDLAHQPC
jgi:hypothetical protein